MMKIVELGHIKDQDGHKRTRVKFDNGVEWLPTITELSKILTAIGECEKGKNDNCYGCIYLRQFTPKEYDEAKKDLEEARESGALKLLADTSQRVAECMCDENKFKGHLTAIDLITVAGSCKYYKLGEKSKEEIYLDFVNGGIWGGVAEYEKHLKMKEEEEE